MATIEKIMTIIEYLAKHPEGKTLAEISKKLKYPKTSVYDILSTLEKIDFIYKKNELIKNYVIGTKLYFYGSSYLQSSNFLHAAKDILEKLADKYEKTAFVSKYDNESYIHVYKYESDNIKASTSDIGIRMELHSNAVGKVFLSYEKDIDLKLLNLKKYTNSTITNLTQLEAELEQIKKHGYAIDQGEQESHLINIAVPVFSNAHEFIGVVSLSGLISQGIEKYEVEDLIDIGKIISQQVFELEKS